MLASTTAATPWGVEARPVQVEVDVHNGLPQVHIVGLPDAAVRESRERVSTAIRNCGFHLEPQAVVINLAPADLPREPASTPTRPGSRSRTTRFPGIAPRAVAEAPAVWRKTKQKRRRPAEEKTSPPDSPFASLAQWVK